MGFYEGLLKDGSDVRRMAHLIYNEGLGAACALVFLVHLAHHGENRTSCKSVQGIPLPNQLAQPDNLCLHMQVAAALNAFAGIIRRLRLDIVDTAATHVDLVVLLQNRMVSSQFQFL